MDFITILVNYPIKKKHPVDPYLQIFIFDEYFLTILTAFVNFFVIIRGVDSNYAICNDSWWFKMAYYEFL